MTAPDIETEPVDEQSVAETPPPPPPEPAVPEPETGSEPPTEAIAALSEATTALAEADTHEFASPEYTAAVERALPLLREGQVVLSEAGGAEQWPELMAQVDKTLSGVQLYLDVNWGSPAEVQTDVDTPAEPAPGQPAEVPVEPDEIIAGAFPVDPPGAWFNDPQLDEPTPLQITAEGRVYGHLATWDTCHTAFAGQCVSAPRSQTNYSYFRTGTVITAEGAEIPVGRITMDTLHARKNASATDALAHYEHTGKATCDVAAGEDSHGIWVAGALRPDVTAEQVRALRSSPLSGDWRRIGGNLEMIAALAVNVPGFPIPRPSGMVASGTLTSLVASGMLTPAKPALRTARGLDLSADDLGYLKRLADRERREQQTATLAASGPPSEQLSDRAAGVARRIRAMRLADRVRGGQS